MFALAAGSGTLIALVRLLMQDTLHGNAPFLFAWPGILLAAFVGGFWPAMLVTVVGVAVAQAVLVQNHLTPLGPGGIAVFAAFGVVFAIAGDLRKRGLRRTAEDARRIAEMRAQLETLTRLNAMGEMAAVLAHELNQPLTAISSYAGAAARRFERDADPQDVGELLGKVSEQAVRAREIIARVRGYVTRGEAAPRHEELSVMFGEAAAVAMADAARPDVVLRSEFDPQAEHVLADRIQVQQVMLNLIRNAIEAMDHVRRRELRIGATADGDGFVQAYVADTGPGVPADVAERLFQPFVTSKGAGMGVGLSISRNIIEQHGGRIWAERNDEGGATFRFTLPRAGGAGSPQMVPGE